MPLSHAAPTDNRCHICHFETNVDDREICHRSGKMICLGCARGGRARLKSLPRQTQADISYALRGLEG